MKLQHGRFRAEDLVLCTDPIYRWGCLGCYVELTLAADDPRATAGLAPRCDRCGTFPMAPIHEPRTVS